MVTKLQSWWQRIREPLQAIVIPFSRVILILLIVVIIIGYFLSWEWTGLGKKTLWDWLQLLIIPVVLAVGGYIFNYVNSRTERDITLDNQQEAALQSYIDKISELLIDKNLRESKEKDEVRTIARVRTWTVLPRLDRERKRSILQFLYESSLIDKNLRIIELDGADLRGANLFFTTLRNADLSKVNLDGSYLVGADLNGANLSETDLNGANLGGASLSGANLFTANLSETILSGDDLSEANLEGANLSGANLLKADLRKAILSVANLQGADLFDADLRNADLRNADLREAEITAEQLHQAMSLEGATMPDGSKHP